MWPTEDAAATATDEKKKTKPVKSYIKVRKLMAQALASSELHKQYVTSKAIARAEVGAAVEDPSPPLLPPPTRTRTYTHPP